MKYVDLIIRYLSGELDEDEAGAFEQELESNAALKEEYDQVSAATRLIGEQIRKDDLEQFRSRLREVMEHPVKGRRFHQRRGRTWLFLLPVAATLAVLIAVLTLNRDPGRIITRFYRPESDPVVLALNQEHRGEMEVGIVLYKRKNYAASIKATKEVLETDPDNQLALLYYLLSSIELDRAEEAIDVVNNRHIRTDHPLGQSITWYSAMAAIKKGRYMEAASRLESLEQIPGPYQERAGRLIKLLERRFSSP
jgi:tetratricopeptide (TPR) repeat protein